MDDAAGRVLAAAGAADGGEAVRGAQTAVAPGLVTGASNGASGEGGSLPTA